MVRTRVCWSNLVPKLLSYENYKILSIVPTSTQIIPRIYLKKYIQNIIKWYLNINFHVCMHLFNMYSTYIKHIIDHNGWTERFFRYKQNFFWWVVGSGLLEFQSSPPHTHTHTHTQTWSNIKVRHCCRLKLYNVYRGLDK